MSYRLESSELAIHAALGASPVDIPPQHARVTLRASAQEIIDRRNLSEGTVAHADALAADLFASLGNWDNLFSILEVC